MRVVVQRCKEAKISEEGQKDASIEQGLVLYVAFHEQDSIETIYAMAQKVLKIRMFDNGMEKRSLSVRQICGSIVSVSGSCLYQELNADGEFYPSTALCGEQAKTMFNAFNRKLKNYVPVKAGRFDFDTDVSLVNDGPVMVLLER